MKSSLFILVTSCLSLFTSLCFGQSDCPPKSYQGRVTINTLNGEGLDGVTIQINGVGNVRTRNGNFNYTLIDCPGSRLRIEPRKEGYAIINHIELAGHILERGLGRGYLHFHIIMCLEKDVSNKRMEYYDKIADLSFARRLAFMEGQIKELRKQASKNIHSNDSLTTLVQRYQRISNDKERQQTKNQEVAKLLTNLNVSSVDTNYQKAFDLYRQGKLSPDNLIVEIIKLDERRDYSRAIAAQARQKAFQDLFTKIDEEVKKVRSEIIQQLGKNWSPDHTTRIYLSSGRPVIRPAEITINNNLDPSLSTRLTYYRLAIENEIVVQLVDGDKKDEILRRPIYSEIDWEQLRSDVKTYWMLLIRAKLSNK